MISTKSPRCGGILLYAQFSFGSEGFGARFHFFREIADELQNPISLVSAIERPRAAKGSFESMKPQLHFVQFVKMLEIAEPIRPLVLVHLRNLTKQRISNEINAPDVSSMLCERAYRHLQAWRPLLPPRNTPSK
jgi:hypothetical protein